MDTIRALVGQVSEGRMRDGLFYLSSNPLPFRTLNYRLPGHEKSTLEEADAYLAAELSSCGYDVEWEAVRAQAFRRDFAKPIALQYSPPAPGDPWYTAYNLYARIAGSEFPDESIVIMSHKDSQSWIPSPGANDNAVGTVGNLELARVVAGYPARRTLVFLFCNEEHHPWTSIRAAERIKAEVGSVVAAINLDGIGVKSGEAREAGRSTNVTRYTTPEGEALADLMARMNQTYALGLEQSKYRSERPGDDDGSFVNAGLAAAVLNIGSMPYADPQYHGEGDVPERVDVINACLSVQLTLAAVLYLDEHGAP